jgi:hypothetical protein
MTIADPPFWSREARGITRKNTGRAAVVMNLRNFICAKRFFCATEIRPIGAITAVIKVFEYRF